MTLRILEQLHDRAKSKPKRIALCDTTDERILQASRMATDDGLALIRLIGPAHDLSQRASILGLSLDGIEISDPQNVPELDDIAALYYASRAGKISSLEEAKDELVTQPLLFAAMLAKIGAVDGVIGGSISTTGSVIRAALKGIGVTHSASILSSMFLMCFPKITGFREQELTLAFADCAVIPEPSSSHLADIAIATAASYETLTGASAQVAMLSFSTKGSAQTESTEKVVHATELARERNPALAIDGELQFDAAFVQSVASNKAPNSDTAGKANVFVFPNLDAGNIGYKIAERLGVGQAIGPILQGLEHPMNDLSRGCKVNDILQMIAITALQSEQKSVATS